jgi:predicted PolB exonuclease-like 3'-5' exonuclease
MNTELFHWDIETVAEYKDFETFELNDSRGAELFKKKYDKLNWVDKYPSYKEAYLEQGGIVSTFGKIVCISYGYVTNTGAHVISSAYGNDEREVVFKFNEVLKKVETKNFNLCGFRLVYFDIPYFLHKLHKYGIKPANILYLYDKKPWEIRVVDISDDWKSKFAWAFSFDEVCYELGVESPKDAMNGSEVHTYYWSGRLEEVKTYCEKDVNSSIKVANLIYK